MPSTKILPPAVWIDGSAQQVCRLPGTIFNRFKRQSPRSLSPLALFHLIPQSCLSPSILSLDCSRLPATAIVVDLFTTLARIHHCRHDTSVPFTTHRHPIVPPIKPYQQPAHLDSFLSPSLVRLPDQHANLRTYLPEDSTPCQTLGFLSSNFNRRLHSSTLKRINNRRQSLILKSFELRACLIHLADLS